jgi:hypothetical protein
MSSRGSAVLAGLFEVWELSETELSEGDRKLALRRWWPGGWGDMACAGERFLPLPSTRPPPSDRREAMASVSRQFGRVPGLGHAAWLAWGAWVRAPLQGANQRGSGTRMGSAGLPACIPWEERCKSRSHRDSVSRSGEASWRANRGSVQRARPIDKSSGALVLWCTGVHGAMTAEWGPGVMFGVSPRCILSFFLTHTRHERPLPRDTGRRLADPRMADPQ